MKKAASATPPGMRLKTSGEVFCISFPPVESADSEILVLGSMPGAESLRLRQYYAFRHNSFWNITGEICGFDAAAPYGERLQALQRAHVAVWDVLMQCERIGSGDATIKHPHPNDIPALLKRCPKIRRICCNGSAAHAYLQRFFPDLKEEILLLPSTSPAAARLTCARKLEIWRAALS